MKEAIEKFAEQFLWEPILANEENLKRTGKYVLCGMGGSHLQGDILQMLNPGLDLLVHADYGLPENITPDRLVIASSYSGNTEETLSAFQAAKEDSSPLAVSSVGGKLIELAKKHGLPYIQIPDTGIQPRSALGYTTKALLKLVGEEGLLKEAGALAETFFPKDFEQEGKELAQRLFGKIPVIYSSRKNLPIAYNWKIKFNESSKIPAFYNVFPELNHNEMAGFDVIDSTKVLSKKLCVIMLKDNQDHPRIQKRMEVTGKLYQDRGVQVEEVLLRGERPLKRIFSSLLLADWTAWYTAKEYGTEPEQVPMIEEFKKLIG
ncbi:MAG: bifunctional phosphoglucose/phosphomannose isomerase [Candidatus Wildermuthbacteria bacterium RIFCSPHIGHO2_02_FULL_49_9]|uniref:Bifunctional phosphoglucose/phosphomannose isomerase n=2 Tax=Candidatus Wildermuthiibacteriota TaxID=1817923 RepID=A0A1G2QZB4_9BACT|nr:MAG: bifunctional phosphoglucose/phosphomannose isomerase [Candidatus Wildermuthbacteria bacterium RIFCSPHIGHO2_01_FULL_49_22b]OHA70444.1 MAG: bifunctional phosphoglucose/phosphomannose isomerase [Candidatus Wildermuthbacteria bacterium RIFCSPHIGHO2_02_FULL_49_9]